MGTFSKEYGSRAEVIMTACDFYSTDGKRLVHTDKAVWDTGSTTTILSHKLIEQLQTQSFRKGDMTGIGGDVSSDTYLVHVAPPTDDVITYIEVMAHDFEDYEAIIGMDVITYGDFKISSLGGKTKFSFRLP